MTAHPPAQPKVSIVIPVYNGSNYVRDAIESALAQTYTNFEVIVVNDGSKDDGATATIVTSYGDRVRYFEKPNGGVATALNLGIEKMEGDYLSWLSHDDVYLENKLAVQIEHLNRLENKQSVLYSDYQTIDEHGKVTDTVRLDHEMLVAKPYYSVLRGSLHGCSMLVPKEAFHKVGGFDPNLATTQDYDLWFRMMTETPFVHIPQTLISSRTHSQQGSKIHPATLKEANELWVSFATDLPDHEKLRCEPSVYLYLLKLAEYLDLTPYAEARTVVAGLAKVEKERVLAQAADTGVSVVVNLGSRREQPDETLRSVQTQTHLDLEILVLSEDEVDPKPRDHGDSRIRSLTFPPGGATEAKNCAIDQATKPFVAFLQVGDVWQSDKIERQLQSMLLSGADFSFTACSNAPGPKIPRSSEGTVSYSSLIEHGSVATSTVMVRHSVFTESPELRFRDSLTDGQDACLWLDLAKRRPALGLRQSLTRLGAHHSETLQHSLEIISHLSQQGAGKLYPIEMATLLRRAAQAADADTANQVLDTLARQDLPWHGAPTTGRLSCWLGRSYLRLPEVLRRPLRTPAQKVLSGLRRHSRQERLLREGLSQRRRSLGMTVRRALGKA